MARGPLAIAALLLPWTAAITGMLIGGTAVHAQAPLLEWISTEPPNASGITTVRGSAEAVAGGADVVAVTLDTGHYATARAAADGSFSTSLFAPAGASVLIKSDPERTFVQQFEDATLLQGFLSQMLSLHGTIVRVQAAAPAAGIPFAFAGLQDFSDGFWGVEGTFDKLQYAPGEAIQVQGTYTLFAKALPRATNPRLEVGMVFDLLSDAEGRPSTAWAVFDSTFMTPTGLPIERVPNTRGPVSAPMPLTVAGAKGSTEFSASFTVPAGLRAGYYVPRLTFSVQGVPSEPPDASVRRVTFVSKPRVWGGASGRPAIVKIGSPAAPRLPALLLMNDLVKGSRGVIAVEDRGLYAPASHITIAAEDAVLPRVDPRTGQPRRYNLEPFAMTVGVTDRGGPPNPPFIAMRFPSGSLTVTVRAPGGSTRTFGPAAFRQWHLVGIGDRNGKTLEGGPHITDPFQLRTLDPSFETTFAEEGLHVVIVDGSIDDLWGNRWRIGGTYELHVGRTLIIDPAVIPMTPFEVANHASAEVRLVPPVPADVEMRVRHAAMSRAPVQTHIAGQANRFGVFVPAQGYRFDQPGEYRVDIVARYRAPDGTIWKGARTWGSVVAPRDGPIIAHGRRGIDAQPTEKQQWYFRSQTGDPLGSTDHLQIPFHAGDVMWLQKSDSAVPFITFQDAGGSVYPTFRAVFVNAGPPTNGTPNGPDVRAALGEIPLVSANMDGTDPHLDPEGADMIGYAYIGVERPLVRVRELIAEDSVGGYWRFGDRYGLQSGSGASGDLPNDFKFQFGGAVLRGELFDPPLYAGYASLFVLVPDDDPEGGSRVFPPFQGNGGGPDGGPLFTLKGQDVDLFFHPTALRPGTILHRGQRVSFAGYSAPTLPAKVEIVVTSPSGKTRTVDGQANTIGWFHDPGQDFTAGEPGVWKAKAKILFDGRTSAGQVSEPFPTGDVLGSRAGEFFFYVVDSNAPQLEVAAMPQFVRPADGPITFTVQPPAGLSNVQLTYTTTMPGFILEEKAQTSMNVIYDALKLAEDFPNLDLLDTDGFAGADTITISMLLSGTDAVGKRRHFARQIVIQGEEIQMPDQLPRPRRRAVR